MTSLLNSQRRQSKDVSEAANLVAIAQKKALESGQSSGQNEEKSKVEGATHVSRWKNKQPGPTRRTNSLADLLIPRRTPTPLNNNNDGPKRSASDKKSDLQRFCCSFRRTRRAKTALDLGINKTNIQEVFVPSYGKINSSLMSIVNDPEAARRGIHALEKGMNKTTLCTQMSRIMSVDENEIEQHEKASRPNGFVVDLNKKKPEVRKLSKAFFQAQEDDGRIGSRRRRGSQNPASSSVGHELNQLDANGDLMNDWELGGHQNKWVCPSDRHLQLRAQLKSGWSCRTANARSPTTTKQQVGVISDAEQEQIRKVLARAEATKQNEQDRLGKMVDRLEKMRTRASGNGVTQCLICQTEFGVGGLLLAKNSSYAAMCIDCRKYVCQKSCGVETFDQKRGEPIFLCKLCSEYREVMWKKSGAWFYKELPQYTKPTELAYSNVSNGGFPLSQALPSTSAHSQQVPSPNPAWPFSASGSRHEPSIQNPNLTQINHGMASMNVNNDGLNFNHTGRQRQLPIPPDQQQRLKTVPRPRITPSWVHEKVQSSMSIGSESDESSSESADASEFKQSVTSMPTGVPAPIPSSRRNAHSRPRELKHGNSSGSVSSTLPTNSASTSARNSMQRYTLTNRNRITDTEESENDESRRTTPSTSPRHSLATPSSYGGDDLSQNHNTLATNETSDAKSIDSGVVQSDHSIQRSQQNALITAGGNPQALQQACISPPPKAAVQIAQNLRTMGNTAAAQFVSNAVTTQQQQVTPLNMPQSSRPSSSQTQQTMLPTERESQLSIVNAPPIPPRSGSTSIGSANPLSAETDRRISIGSNSTNTSQVRSSPRFPSNPTSSHESLSTAPAPSSRISSTDVTPRNHLNSRDSLSIVPNEMEPIANSPTFMSDPDSEDDSKTIKEMMAKRRKQSPASRLSAAFSSLRSGHKHGLKSKSVDKSNGLSASSSASKITESPSKTLSGRLSATFDERTEDEMARKIARTPSPRRPMSASSLLATINESASSRVPSDDENMLDEEKHDIVTLNGSISSAQAPRRRSGTLGSIQFNLTYLAEEKQLIIHLIRAKNLKAMDKNGLSDPYVKFHIIPGNAKATKLTSKTIEKTLNPEWNEEMVYYGIMEEERQKKTLRVTVLDRDRIGSDFLGETRVALRKLPLNQTKKFNLYLEHVMAAPSEKAEDERGKILISICYNIQQGSLFVHIKRCAELLGMDSTGLSDPYCKVSLTPVSSKLHRQRTAIKKRTLNPEFNENLAFIVPFKDLPRKALEVKVYDHDVAKSDDFIGGVLLSTAAPGQRGQQWTSAIENPGKTFESWHKLETD